MSFTFAEPPAQLIGANGRPLFGVYAGPIANVNMEDFPYKELRRFPFSISAGAAAWLAKKWQFVGVVDKDFVLGAAVVHINYIGTAFAYAYDRATKQLHEINLKAPLCKGVQFSDSSISGTSSFRGKHQVVLDNAFTDNKRSVLIQHGDKLAADITYQETGTGVTTVSRTGVYGFNHCYKVVAMPATGTVTYGGQTRQLSPDALALLDWSSGTPARETYWNWACGMGPDADGTILGLNFACGMNETMYTENAVWVDGQPEKVDVISFDYDLHNVLTPWHVTSMDGKVDLTFHPDAERYEDQNYGLVTSRLHQPFGRFEGTIKTGKKTYKVENIYGFCEEHYAKW